MSTEYAILFEEEHCIECRGCVVACKSWRQVPLGIAWRRVGRIWRGAYPQVTMASVSIGCMHCVDAPCVAVCPAEAIAKGADDGIVRVDQAKCVGCHSCEAACPFGAPQFGPDDTMQKCDLCADTVDHATEEPPCVATCPTNALRLVRVPVETKAREAAVMRKRVSG